MNLPCFLVERQESSMWTQASTSPRSGKSWNVACHGAQGKLSPPANWFLVGHLPSER